MASFRICSGGNCSLNRFTNESDRRNPDHRRTSVAVARRRQTLHHGLTAMGESANGLAEQQAEQRRRPISQETIDEWVRESASEIVRNLPQAPLLIRVMEEAGGRERRRLEVETGASGEIWETWRKTSRQRVPEGVIVVEELKDGRDSRGVYWDGKIDDVEEGSTKVWPVGMVAQGRGLECGPVCYLLKTSRVGSSNLGCACTHF
uniref:DUF7804 domain-containing protein n=1 Tax=Kalanchoe fedtschenkoi TaxID=63787 RepID=A0A7N0RIY7_KALFE